MVPINICCLVSERITAAFFSRCCFAPLLLLLGLLKYDEVVGGDDSDDVTATLAEVVLADGLVVWLLPLPLLL